MDAYSSYHELQFQQSSSSDQGYYPFPSSSSSSSPPSYTSTNRLTFSDEDNIQLASTNPKKRAGRKKFKETRHPIYRGVRQRNSGKWVCEVREPTTQKRIWLGTFPTVEMAARAHDVAAMALRGRSACLNFADSAWRLPVPASNDTKDIQRAAAEAAECFRPPAKGMVTTSTTPVEGHETGDVVMELEEEATESYHESVTPTPFYMDDEDVFHMPALLADMYDGMMIPPPSYSSGYAVDDSQALDFDLPLWSYSV